MIEYLLDIYLCGMVVIAELIGAMAIAILFQYVFYKVFKINLYKSFWKFSDRLEKRISEIF